MRTTPESAGTAWRKSSHSGAQGGECVEVAVAGAAVAVRDSKCPDGPRLAVGGAAWTDFLRFAAPRRG